MAKKHLKNSQIGDKKQAKFNKIYAKNHKKLGKMPSFFLLRHLIKFFFSNHSSYILREEWQVK